MGSTPSGTPPFVARWLQERESQAQTLARSLLFWYRQQYQIPRNDPRLNLTPEELWEEYRAWEIAQDPPEPPETVETAWQAACAAGRYDPSDRTARAQFMAQWHRDHGDPETGGADAPGEEMPVQPPPPPPPDDEEE